jgi:hypothetical protein
MTNPFDKIIQDRLAKEAANKLNAEKRERENAEYERCRLELGNQYNDMVIRILEQLKSVVYPDCKITVNLSEPSWSIDRKIYVDSGSHEYEGYERWESEISVAISINTFICKKGKSEKQSPLSEPELIEILLLLHQNKE